MIHRLTSRETILWAREAKLFGRKTATGFSEWGDSFNSACPTCRLWTFCPWSCSQRKWLSYCLDSIQQTGSSGLPTWVSSLTTLNIPGYILGEVEQREQCLDSHVDWCSLLPGPALCLGPAGKQWSLSYVIPGSPEGQSMAYRPFGGSWWCQEDSH